MKQVNVTTITTPRKTAQVLLQDKGKVLKVKTGLKGGGTTGEIDDPMKATPILF